MKDINKQIAEAQAELEKLMKEKERQESLPDDKLLAEWMHDSFCYHDHTEYCGWFYDKDWSGSSRASYLKKAREMLKIADITTVMEILRAYKKL